MSKNFKEFPGEEWKKYELKKGTNSKVYHISNFGRIKSVDRNSKSEMIIKSSLLKVGFMKATIRIKGGTCEAIYPHRAVAELFLEPKSELHSNVIHRDFNRTNNTSKNLAWVTDEERKVYLKNRAIKYGYDKKPHKKGVGNYKLSEAKVAIIKKELSKGKTRKKMIAKRFGVTATQINRIEKGENWAWVKPIH